MRYFVLLFFLVGCATTNQVKMQHKTPPKDLLEIEEEVEREEIVKEEKIIEKEPKPVSVKNKKIVEKKVKQKPLFEKEQAVYDVSLKGVHSGKATIEAMGEHKGFEYFFARIKTSAFISMFFNVEHNVNRCQNAKLGLCGDYLKCTNLL